MALVASATKNFNEAGRIGSGATGDVFRGEIDGAPVAAKCLRLPKIRNPEMRLELRRRFDAELGTLRRFQHERVVKILGYAISDEEDAPYPFVLVFELLEEGSIADWLRKANGDPSGKPILSAGERVDIALGAVLGISFLHGLSDDQEGGGGAAGGLCVLHRDVKSANVGLARRRRDGPLCPKILDCGLAKAIRGADEAAAAVGVSFTAGLVAGTAGYMAPEVADGTYTVRSEVFAVGVVLLELLLGQLVEKSTATAARDIADDAKDAGGDGIATLAVRADSVWPPEAAATLAALILDCIRHRPAMRPSDMAVVLRRLKEVRALVDASAPPLVRCGICFEEVPEDAGMRCSSGHFYCNESLQGALEALANDPRGMSLSSGRLACPEPGCRAKPWALEDLQGSLDKGTLVVFSRALRYALFDGPAAKRQAEKELADREAELKKKSVALAEKVQKMRQLIVDRYLYMLCPVCAEKSDEHELSECNALCCARCGAGFCALCLLACGNSRGAHEHFRPSCPATSGGLFDRPAFIRTRKDRFTAQVIAAVKALASEGADFQRALVAELAKADLRDLGITADQVLNGAGVVKTGPIEALHGTGQVKLPLAKQMGAAAMPPPLSVCAACTFINAPGVEVCDMCDARLV